MFGLIIFTFLTSVKLHLSGPNLIANRSCKCGIGLLLFFVIICRSTRLIMFETRMGVGLLEAGLGVGLVDCSEHARGTQLRKIENQEPGTSRDQ